MVIVLDTMSPASLYGVAAATLLRPAFGAAARNPSAVAFVRSLHNRPVGTRPLLSLLPQEPAPSDDDIEKWASMHEEA